MPTARPDTSNDAEPAMSYTTPWIWKMQWCKQRGLPPARTDAWEQAEKAWALAHKATAASN